MPDCHNHTSAMKHSVLFLLLALSPAFAQLPAKPVTGKPLAPEDVAKLKERLAKLETELEKRRGSLSGKLVAELTAAAQGPDRAVNFWLECHKEVEFIQKGRTASEFSDWRRKEGKQMEENKKFGLERQMQLRFLVLAIQSAYAETPAQEKDVATAAMSYLAGLADACEREEILAREVLGSVMSLDFDPDEPVTKGTLAEAIKENREVRTSLGTNILDTTFARRFKIDGTLPQGKHAVKNPGDLGGIFETAVLSVFREKEDAPALASAWTKRIELSARIAKACGDRHHLERFNAEQLPLLKWGQAKEQYMAGNQVAASDAMLAAISGYPEHPECDEWITEMQSLVEGSLESSPSETAPAAEEEEASTPATPSKTPETAPAPAPETKPMPPEPPPPPPAPPEPAIKPELTDPTKG